MHNTVPGITFEEKRDNMRFRKSKSDKGLTILELMITVVIVGIVAAMAAPTFERSIQQFYFKSKTKDVLSTLRKARSNAITEKVPYGVSFNDATMEITAFRDETNQPAFTYDVGSDPVISVDTLQGDWSYVWSTFTNQAVVYQPNGTASESGWIYLYSEKDGSYNSSWMTVLASTGRSKIHWIWNY
jgi:type IV fimbrial biogenesis protein FimT